MQGRFAGKLGVESLEKLQELLMTMPGIALADDAAFDDVERGKQRGGPVTLVVVSVGAAATGFERQTGLRAMDCWYTTASTEPSQ
jgi:hypothetical protein